MEKTKHDRGALEALRVRLEQAFDRQDMEEMLRLSALMDALTVARG